MIRIGKPAFAYDHLGDVAQDKMCQATLPVRSYHQQVRTEFRCWLDDASSHVLLRSGTGFRS